MTIKAIETRYAGCRFRSRLEARWAVFFDALGYEWEYEPEGFVVGIMQGSSGTPYLPDFRIRTEYNPRPIWVEVKGTEEDLNKMLLIDAMDWGLGLPDVNYTHGSTDDDAIGGLLILGQIPRIENFADLPMHTLLTHDSGVWHNLGVFYPEGVEFDYGPDCYSDQWAGPCITRDDGCDWLKAILDTRLDCPSHRIIHNAYTKARSARFEHGEKG